MSSGRLHNIFGKKGRLDRDDIQQYSQTSDPKLKNAIEQKASADAFGEDALEGWEALGYDTSAMQSLDKKFSPKSNSGWYITGVALTIVIVSVLVFNSLNTTPTTTTTAQTDTTETIQPTSEEQEIILDESDVFLPEPIEQMSNAPKAEQVNPEVIIDDFKEIEAIRIEEPPVPVATLPIIDIDLESAEDRKIIRAHEWAKEIYLHDLKLVDYRNYRSKPKIRTRQLTLTGTPASQETQFADSSDFEQDPTWRDVDVPYIDFIDKSMRIFGRGNYKKALLRYETVLKTYPADVNANFYAGVCLFNLGEHQLAIEHFDACVNGPYANFDEEAVWMKALSYEHLGRRNEARSLFKKIASEEGFYADQATQKLK